MATRKAKIVAPPIDEVAEEEEKVVSVSFTPATVETVTDKNGASVTIVSGWAAVPNNTPIRVKIGERSFNGGLTVNGEYKAFIGAADGEVEVYARDERVG